MSPQVRGIVNLFGRIALSAIFLLSAVGNKIPNFSGVVGYMKSEGVPAPEFLLSGAIVFLIAGSLSLIVGYQARLGATLLLVFLMAATFFFHDFWTVPADAFWIHSLYPDVKLPIKMVENISFMKNVALMGAMLMVIANGAGPLSWDERRATGN